MLCFTASAFLVVLQLGETRPIFGHIFQGVSGAQLCFLDPILSLPCCRWILHTVLLWCFWRISYPCSLHFSGSHKTSFPTPSLKSGTKGETCGKSSSRAFLLAFESSVLRTGKAFSSKLMNSSILLSTCESLMVGASKNLAQTKDPMVCGVQEWTGHGPAAAQSLWRLCKQWHLLPSSLWLREGVPL